MSAKRGGLVHIRISLAAQLMIPNPCPNAQPVPQQLKIPATLPPGEPVAFEKQLLSSFSTLGYRNPGQL